MVLERKTIGKDDEGNPIEVDVVASIKDLIICCDKILDRAVGKPSQEMDLNSKQGLTVLVRAFDPDADKSEERRHGRVRECNTSRESTPKTAASLM